MSTRPTSPVLEDATEEQDHDRGGLGLRRGISRETRPDGDFWERQWASPVLQRLGRWLTKHGCTDAEAEQAVARVWSFYSYFVIPAFGGYPPMGISATMSHGHLDVRLEIRYPPRSSTNGQMREQLGESLAADLQRFERRPVTPLLSIHLLLHGRDWDAKRTRRDHLGIYQDDLLAELKRTISPASWHAWLETSNEQLGGRKPVALIGDPAQDHLLRDIVLAAKDG